MRQAASTPIFAAYRSRQDAAQAASELAAMTLREGVMKQGRASLAVPGGSTPGPMFRHLAGAELDWSKLQVGLVDERFVPPDHEASNEKLVRDTLLQGKAAASSFLPMWRENKTAQSAAIDASAAYRDMAPFDFILLGMGPDGHTASWFPGARNLHDALSPRAETIVAIDASGCKVAGEHTQRLTLSLPAIASARQAALLIYGEEKRDVFRAACTGPASEYPVRAAIEGLGNRLSVLWAE